MCRVKCSRVMCHVDPTLAVSPAKSRGTHAVVIMARSPLSIHYNMKASTCGGKYSRCSMLLIHHCVVRGLKPPVPYHSPNVTVHDAFMRAVVDVPVRPCISLGALH